MLKTPEEKPAYEMVLFQKPKEIVKKKKKQNCQPQQDERRYNFYEKEAGKKRNRRVWDELDEIRKVFKKTKNVLITEPQIKTITGGKNPQIANSESQISNREDKIENFFKKTENKNKKVKMIGKRMVSV